MPWTPEQIDRLRALAPLSSPKEIASIFGMTKNAVMGKMHRLNIAIRDARKPRPIPRSPTEILREREVRLRAKGQAVAWSNRRRAERNETWTAERVAMLRLLAPRGSSAIASEMGLTKPQVKSKARRLGIALGRPPRPKEKAMASRVMRQIISLATEIEPIFAENLQNPPPHPPHQPILTPIPILGLVCEGVDFAGLKRHSCRYPVKCDDNGFIRLYCGESARPESSWCRFHEKIVWLPAFERRRA